MSIMPVNKNSQQQYQTMNKKLNQGQRTRKVQYFKKKSHHLKTISDQAARQFSHSEMIQLVEDQTLSMSSPSSSFVKKKCYPLHTESNIDPTLFLTDYSMLTDKTFKEMLLTMIVSDIDRNSLNKLLNIEETLISIRQLTQLINKLNYFELQVEQWTYYYNLGINESIWTGRVSKNMALVNSMCYTYGRSKVLIEQRHKKYKKNLQKIQINIDEHMKQIALSTVDMDKLMTILIDLVQKDQYELRVELERRRGILKFDAKDHQLVHTFYNLKPRQTEIHSAKLIWKAIHDEQALRYEIALFKYWLSSSKSSSLTLCTFQDLALTKINNIFTHLIFDKQMSSTRICLTNNQTNSINQFIEDIIEETISRTETIADHYIQKVKDEKTKILNNQEKFKKPPTVDTIITAIENRQMNMVQRAQYNIEQILKSVFQINILDNI